jgi:hypothetical protein
MDEKQVSFSEIFAFPSYFIIFLNSDSQHGSAEPIYMIGSERPMSQSGGGFAGTTTYTVAGASSPRGSLVESVDVHEAYGPPFMDPHRPLQYQRKTIPIF